MKSFLPKAVQISNFEMILRSRYRVKKIWRFAYESHMIALCFLWVKCRWTFRWLHFNGQVHETLSQSLEGFEVWLAQKVPLSEQSSTRSFSLFPMFIACISLRKGIVRKERESRRCRHQSGSTVLSFINLFTWFPFSNWVTGGKFVGGCAASS